jgi:hypothetical protein
MPSKSVQLMPIHTERRHENAVIKDATTMGWVG